MRIAKFRSILNPLRLYILIFCYLINSNICSANPDSISSSYNDGTFETNHKVKTKGNAELADALSEYLVNDFHYAPGHLFEWALKDLGLQNKGNELIIVFKSSVHDTKTGITHGVFDIVVPGVTTFNNIKVDAIVNRTKYKSGVVKVTANIIYSSLLLKNAVATVLFVPTKNNELMFDTNMKITFGWFFNLFITKKRYKSIVEWRIQKFSENMIKESETRNNLSK